MLFSGTTSYINNDSIKLAYRRATVYHVNIGTSQSTTSCVADTTNDPDVPTKELLTDSNGYLSDRGDDPFNEDTIISTTSLYYNPSF